MALTSGKLGSAAVAAGAWTTVYTVPASTAATANIRVVNRGATASLLRIGITAANTPPDADLIEFDAPLPASGGVLEDTAIVCGPGEKIMVFSAATAVSVRVHGYEKAV